MKNFQKNSTLMFVCFIILFACISPLILSFIIPSSATITDSEKGGMWIPEGYRWIVSSKEPDTNAVMGNSAKKINDSPINETYNATVYFCGILPLKTVEVAVVDEKSVTLGGDAIGINLRTEGVLVAEVDKVKTADGKTVSPGSDAGLKAGDIIKSINGTKVSKKEEISQLVESGINPLKICFVRNGKETECELESIIDENGKRVIGIWIRDTVAGIGTVTFYSDGKFGALGHPILDIDTGQFVNTSGGVVYPAGIVGVDKGESGSPGSLKGIFTINRIGEINKNSPYGVFGTAEPSSGKTVPIGKKSEIRCRDAQIVCDVGNGPETFGIEIQRIMLTSDTSKCMVIHITDQRLIEKTGGIVQGMSGSPIIQNGKLIGAVTHVFVNDPTKGYGIFIENMLAEAE